MLGRRKADKSARRPPVRPASKPPALTWGRSSLDGYSESKDGVFKIAPTTSFYPLNVHWWVSLYAGQGEIRIGTPYGKGPDAIEIFRLVDVPEAEWTPLVCRNGRTIPLEIYVDPTGAFARWLS